MLNYTEANLSSKNIPLREVNALEHLIAYGGACTASDWVTGRGKNASKRDTPILCVELDVMGQTPTEFIGVNGLGGTVAKTVRQILTEAPKTRKIVLIKDYRKASAIVKAYRKSRES